MNQHAATPEFAMSFTPEAVQLEQRSGPDWRALGQARFAGGDLASELVALRDGAGGQPGELDTVLVIPDDQILYTVLTVPFGSDTAATIARALEAATPYGAQDLVFDWCPAANGDIETLRVAAVARRTLDEAEDFARAQGFRPSGFQARPGDDRFDAQPDFGPSRLAQEQFNRHPFSEPDLTQAGINDARIAAPAEAAVSPTAAVTAPVIVSRITPHVVPAAATPGPVPSIAADPVAPPTPSQDATPPVTTQTIAAQAGVIRHGQAVAGPVHPRLSLRAEAVHNRAAAARAQRIPADDAPAASGPGLLARLKHLDPTRLPVMVGGLALILVLALLFLGRPTSQIGGNRPADFPPLPETAALPTSDPAPTSLPEAVATDVTPAPAAPAADSLDALDRALAEALAAARPEPQVEATPTPANPELAATQTAPNAALTDSAAFAPAPSAIAPQDSVAAPQTAPDAALTDDTAFAPASSAIAPQDSVAASQTAPDAGSSPAPAQTQPAPVAEAAAPAAAPAPAPAASAPPPAAAPAPAAAAPSLASSARPPRATPASASQPAAPDVRPTVPANPLPYVAQPQAVAAPARSSRPPERPAPQAAAPAQSGTAQPNPAAAPVSRAVPASAPPAPAPRAAATSAAPAADAAPVAQGGSTRPPARPQGDAPATDRPLTPAERDEVRLLLRDLRTAQAGDAGLGAAEAGALLQLAQARPSRRPVDVRAPAQRAVEEAVSEAASSSRPSTPRPASRASTAGLTQAAPAAQPVAGPSGAILRSARPGARPGAARTVAAPAADDDAVQAAIASAIGSSSAMPGAVPLTALTSSAIPPRRVGGAGVNAMVASAAPLAAAAIPPVAAITPTAPDSQAALDAQRRADDALQAQAEARARSQAAADAQAEAQARAAAEARAQAQAAAEAQTAAARNQRYQPPEVDSEPDVVAAVPREAIGNAAASATVSDGIQLRSTQIIGTIGAGRASRALVRLSNGRVLTLRLGDRINGGQITEIGDSRITYTKQGRAHALGVLNGQ